MKPDVEPRHETVTKEGYELTFHPAFARLCTVTLEGRTLQLYEQKGIHKLPAGQGHPKKHRIHLKGGKLRRDIQVTIDDPDHRVAGITLELYADDHVPGSAEPARAVEQLRVQNGAPTCPPAC